MNHAFKLVISATALSLLAACGNNSSGTDAVSAGKSAEPIASAVVSVATAVNAYRSEPVTAESPTKPRDLNLAPVPTNITLGAPEVSKLDAARKNNESTAADQLGKPLQIGFGRDVAQTATATATNQVLKWQATATGGQVAAINFSSTGAKGMRIGLLVTQLPATATLRFYAKGAATAFEVKGAAVLDVLAKNLSAGDVTDEGRTYWSPVIKANNGTLEIEVPAGIDTNSVQISIPSVSHLFMSMTDAQDISPQATYTGGSNYSTMACQVDVTCATLPAISDAVAWLVFNKSGGTSICSGTMLNDNLNSSTPYLLTANHCFSNQTEASSLYTEFKYRSLACNNAATGEYFPTATTGATLLYTATNTDSTLVRLIGTPSTTVLFAGWDATVAPALNTAVHSIHHPQGDQQRISRGSISSYYARSGTTGLSTSNMTSGTILGITQNSGNTEPGSSGSSLVKGADSNPQVIGQLYGRLLTNPTTADPGEVCSNSTLTRIYGRFDVAFNGGMKDWLVQEVKSVIQFYNASSGVHYYSYNTTDLNTFTTSNPAYSNQGQSFKVSSYQTAGLLPVYRFYNTSNGSYFYTISEKERAAVASNTPRMRSDGVVWYASATLAGANTLAVYSAFNAATGSQYFTTSSAARDTLILNSPQFKKDGIAFYVTP